MNGLIHHMRFRGVLCALLGVCLAGCGLLEGLPAPLRPVQQPQIAQLSLEDARYVMQGICFEAALELADGVLIVRNGLDLIRLYDRIDQTGLCRRAIQREAFDFSDDRVLIGLFSAGRGCTAWHEVLSAQRDAAAMRINLRLRFITEGDCNYELVRPYWVAVRDAEGYAIEVTVD